MKRNALITVITLVVPLFVFSQSFIKSHDNYFDNILILKVKAEYKEDFKNNIEFKSVLSDLPLKHIEKMFPDSEIPRQKYNERGEKLVDLSLIYELVFSNSIDVFDLVTKLSKMDFVEYVEPLYHVELLYVPDDPMNLTHQYWLDNISAYDAWNIHQGDTNTVIGIVDTGIDISHEDLIYNIAYNWNDLPNGNDDDNDGYIDNFRGWDFGDNNNNPQAEVSFHGSWVSGIAAATTDNGLGISGVGFKCRLLPIKVMNSDGVINTAYQGVVYAADQGAKVINCSWGNTTYQQMAQDVINYVTYNRDALVIGACGNSNSELIFYPASYENVISVAATNIDDERWSPENTNTTGGSSYSPMVDISAPGTMMRTTGNGDYFLTYGGTSFAAPVVAGGAALLRSYYPELSALQIGELLKAGTDNIDTIPFNTNYAGMLGTGRLNIYNSITMDFVPAVNLKNVEISENRDINDIVYIYGNLINYLAPVNNLTVTVTSASPYVQILNSSFSVGSLQTFGSYEITDQIRFEILPNMPKDYFTFINLEFNGDNYQYTQSIPVTMNYSFRNIETDKLLLSIVRDGRFGYSDLDRRIGNGMRYNNAYGLFYDAGIISGTSANNIYCAVRQNSDFNSVLLPEIIENPEIGDYLIQTIFTDSSNESEGLTFSQKAYVWDNQDYKDFIIVQYEIINNSNDDIDSYYFGIFADWDLIEPQNNSAKYNSDYDIMYCQNNGNQNMVAGLKLLSNQNVNNYAVPQISGGDGIIDLTDGLSDQEKFFIISNSSGNVGSAEEAYDVVIVTSAGPFDIPAGDTVEVVFTFIAAQSTFTLFQASETAMDLYKSQFSESYIVDTNSILFKVFPNPADDKIEVYLGSKFLNEPIVLDMYDGKGKLVLRKNKTVSAERFVLNTSSFGSGIYFLNIFSDKYKTQSKKIIISR